MEHLETYFDEYANSFMAGSDYNGYLCGYTCLNCNSWVPPGTYHYCYPCSVYYPSLPSNTDKAFKIMKLLVREKLIKEPESFKRFCELIEKIAREI